MVRPVQLIPRQAATHPVSLWGSQPVRKRSPGPGCVSWPVAGTRVFGGDDCAPSKPTLWLWYASLFQLNPHYPCQIDTHKHPNGSKPLQIPTSCEAFTIQMQRWKPEGCQLPRCRLPFGNHTQRWYVHKHMSNYHEHKHQHHLHLWYTSILPPFPLLCWIKQRLVISLPS